MGDKKRVITLISLLFSACMIWSDPISFVFTHYEPANYVDDQGKYGGFLYEITAEAFENRLAVPLDITVLPWPRCQQMVRNGTADMMLTIPTEERLEYARATDSPVWIKSRLIYTYNRHIRMEEIDSLRGLDGIRESGFTIVSYIGNQWVTENVEALDIPVVYASSVEGMYRILAAKRADIIIEEPSIALSNLEKLGLTGRIIESEGIASESPFHLLISKKSPFLPLMDDLNRVLEEMGDDGTIKKILDKYGN